MIKYQLKEILEMPKEKNAEKVLLFKQLKDSHGQENFDKARDELIAEAAEAKKAQEDKLAKNNFKKNQTPSLSSTQGMYRKNTAKITNEKTQDSPEPRSKNKPIVL